MLPQPPSLNMFVPSQRRCISTTSVHFYNVLHPKQYFSQIVLAYQNTPFCNWLTSDAISIEILPFFTWQYLIVITLTQTSFLAIVSAYSMSVYRWQQVSYHCFSLTHLNLNFLFNFHNYVKFDFDNSCKYYRKAFVGALFFHRVIISYSSS